MLNALRHQWFGSKVQLFGIRPRDSVLNALRHQWFGRRCRSGNRPGRLVLNALRHQWFGSAAAGGIVRIMAWVLNALRHQWFGSAALETLAVQALLEGFAR